MEQRPWWESSVIYQIYPRSFQDTTGSGVGDLPGITARLPYVAELGIDAVWISPFYPSPMADFGYDVTDHTDVHPMFGTLDDFDRLLETAHGLDLRVIVDIVPNHTSNRHPWFLESRLSRNSPKRDWYVWRDPGPDGAVPNNWLSAFGGSAWQWDDDTGQYYLHSFIAEQPDLNWRNPEVVEAMLDVYRFWLDRGVDGFRIDVAHFILKDPDFRDNPPAPADYTGYYKPMGEYASQLHLHDMAHPDIHPVYQRVRRLTDEYQPDRVIIGEVDMFDWDQWVGYYGEALDEMHLPFNFTLLYVPWEADAVRTTVGELEAALPEGAWPNYVLGNHDVPRLASRFEGDRARLAAMLLLTLRGTPTLYYGDELGIDQVPIPADRQQDPWAIREPELGRDGCRTPMQWDATASAGFSTADRSELWLPLTSDHRHTNVAAQSNDETSLLTLYRRLLAVRRRLPSLQHGSYQAVTPTPSDVFAFVRSDRDERVTVVLNFASEPVEFVHDMVAGAEPVLSTRLRPVVVDGDALTLHGDEGVILRL